MIKLVIGVIILIVAGVAWLRMQWAIDKNKRAAGKIVDGLKNGTYSVESFEESLNMQIRTRPLPAGVNMNSIQQSVAALANTKLKNKF